jgi:hypothetical protein
MNHAAASNHALSNSRHISDGLLPERRQAAVMQTCPTSNPTSPNMDFSKLPRLPFLTRTLRILLLLVVLGTGHGLLLGDAT